MPWPVPWSKSSPASQSGRRAKRVDLRARGALGEDRAGDGDVALEDPREALAHLGGRLADGDRAGDVGRAVLILRAGIDQIDLAGPRVAIGRAGDPVMRRWRRSGPAPLDGRERDVTKLARLRPKVLQGLDRIDLRETSRRRLAVEPGQEACRPRPRRADARSGSRRSRPGSSRPSSASIGSGTAIDAAAGASMRRINAVAPVAESILILRAVRPELFDLVLRGATGRRRSARSADRIARPRSRSWHGSKQNPAEPSRGMMRVAERQRRVADIAAPQVEAPGEVLRIRHDEAVEPLLRPASRASASSFASRRLAGEAARMQAGPARRGGAGRSSQTASSGLHVDRRRASPPAFAAAFSRLSTPSLRVQPGIVAEHAGPREFGLDPGLRARLGLRHGGEELGVDLFAGLERVAPVDHDRGLVGEDHRRAGRTREAGQPGQAVGARGHVFATGARPRAAR